MGDELLNPSPTLMLQRARAGDDNALDALLGRYRRYLSLLARLYVRERLQAKVDPSDLAQETCLEACRSFASFRGDSAAEFVAWLKQILASKGMQHVRRFLRTQRRNVSLEQPLEWSLDESSALLDRFAERTKSSPSQAAAKQEAALHLADALATLSPVEREVIIQHGLEGHTMSEVAARMGRNVDGTWKIWARGLLKLRRLLPET